MRGETAFDALQAHRHQRGPLVFCREDGSYRTGGEVQHHFRRLAERSGLPVVRFHDLRHSFASQLVLAGVPMRGVQELLGHAHMQTTMRYAHLSPDACRDYVALLD